MQGYSNWANLDQLYNTQINLVIQSQYRASGYPTPQFYQIPTPPFGGVKEIFLTHYIGATGIAPANSATFLVINEINPTNTYLPGYPQPRAVFLIPNAAELYTPQFPEANMVSFPKDRAPNISNMTFSFYDANGVAIASMPEHILKFYIKAWY